MEPTIPVDEARFVLESQIRDCFGRVAYSHKTHEKMAERYASRLNITKWGMILLSALITGGMTGVLFDKSSSFFPIVTAVLSILSLVFNSYMKDVDPGTNAQRHREAASKLWNMRVSYLSLLMDIKDKAVGMEALRKRRDQLQSDLVRIYSSAPHTDDGAYGQAQEALQKNEDLTFSDEELDRLLPPSIQRGRSDKP